MNQKQTLAKRQSESNLVRAFQELSDGVVTLLRQHLELFREEAKRDVRVFSKQASLVVVGALLLMVGYIFVWAAIGALAYVYANAKIAAFTILFASMLHLLVGGLFVRGGLRRIQDQRRDALASAKLELEKSAQWVKQISTDSSSPQTDNS